MNILHIGCSWSEHNTDYLNNTKDSYLSSPGNAVKTKLLNNHDLNTNYYISARGGTSIGLHIDLLKQITDVQKFDGIIFQITSPLRNFDRISNFNSFDPENWTKVNDLKHDIFICNQYIDNNYLWFSTGKVNPYPQRNTFQFKLMKKFQRCSMGLNRSFVTEWLGQILYAKQFINQLGIPSIFYCHTLSFLDSNEKYYFNEVKNLSDFIADEEFNMQKYIIDNGFHVNKDGNEKIANILENLILKKFVQIDNR